MFLIDTTGRPGDVVVMTQRIKIMSKKRSDSFYKLLHEIEYEIGSECYNNNIKNFGPGGIWEGDGRDFRYPLRFINSVGKIEQYKGIFPHTMSSSGQSLNFILGEERYNSAHYAFGANQLFVFRGIKHALDKLEKRFNIDFDELLKEEHERENNP